MSADYETTLTITTAGSDHGRDGKAGGGVALLDTVRRLILDELQSAAGQPPPDCETGHIDGAGYAIISTERAHPRAAGYSVRLEVRLCTAAGDDSAGHGIGDHDNDNGNSDDRLAAQIRTRFISADGYEPPDLPAGPPNLLTVLLESRPCLIGAMAINGKPVTVAADNAGWLASEQILHPARTLPILLISEGNYGRTAVEPEDAQRILNGVAQVARLTPSGEAELRKVTGGRLSCYNGAARILWPGCSYNQNGPGPGQSFYWPDEVAAAGFLLRRQQEILQRTAEIGNDDFERAFNAARVAVILERNRQLEAASERDPGSTAAIAGAGTDTDAGPELRRELRKEQMRHNEARRQWKSAMASVSRLEQELAAAQTRADRLEQEAAAAQSDAAGDRENNSRRLREGNARLRRQVADKEIIIAHLNDENQRYRQGERQRQMMTADGVISIAGAHPGNVTALNHAINLCRDPLRGYIIGRLRERYGGNLRDVLGRSVEFRYDRHHRAATEPAAAIDVGDFESVVADNSACFADSAALARQLREVRSIRNRAAHPPPGGLAYDYTVDGLREIAKALDLINDGFARREVAALAETVRQESGQEYPQTVSEPRL